MINDSKENGDVSDESIVMYDKSDNNDDDGDYDDGDEMTMMIMMLGMIPNPHDCFQPSQTAFCS